MKRLSFVCIIVLILSCRDFTIVTEEKSEKEKINNTTIAISNDFDFYPQKNTNKANGLLII